MDLDNFIISKTKGEERREEIWQKNNSCLTNIERKRCKKSSYCFPNIEDRKGGKKQQLLISRGPFDHHMSYLICLS